MLPQHVANLVECVRALQMDVVERKGQEALKVKGGAEHLPQRLISLQRALEAFDAAEGELDESDISRAYKATHLILKQIAGNGQIKGNPVKVLSQAFERYGEQDWVGARPGRAAEKKTGLTDALSSSNAFRSRALEKAQRDIEARAERERDEDDQRDPFAPGAR